jgi:hypothetical protein
MHDGKLMELIDQAVELDRDIREKTEELKGLKSRIAQEAASRDGEQLATDGGGWSWTMQGERGCLCRVTAPAPTLKSEIDGEGKTIEKVREAAGPHFAKLFQQAPKYKLIPGFREEAQGLLGRAAAKLIKLCTTTSSPRVSFETKPEEAKV